MNIFGKKKPAEHVEHQWDTSKPDTWIGLWGVMGPVGSGIIPQHFGIQVLLRCKVCDVRRMVVWRVLRRDTLEQVADLDGNMGPAPDWVYNLA